MSNSTDILDYDALVQEFEDGLVNNLIFSKCGCPTLTL